MSDEYIYRPVKASWFDLALAVVVSVAAIAVIGSMVHLRWTYANSLEDEPAHYNFRKGFSVHRSAQCRICKKVDFTANMVGTAEDGWVHEQCKENKDE